MSKAGRPTKYKTIYCDMVIEHMANGFSIESFAGKISISKDTIYQWINKYKEFSDSVQLGVAKSQLFWEELGIKGLWNVSTGGGKSMSMNSTMWTFNMKNRFKWRDQIDVKSDEKITKTITLNYSLPEKKKDE